MGDIFTRWEDDGFWATDPAAEEVSRMLDAICPHCDRALHQCTCADADAVGYCPVCGSYWEDGCRCEGYPTRIYYNRLEGWDDRNG